MVDELTRRAQKIRMLVLDVDGVLTDGRMYFGPWPSPAIGFNTLDGSGIRYLYRSGLSAAIVSGRSSPAVTQRAAMLGIEDVHQDAKVKLEPYETIRRKHQLDDCQIAYMGDDLVDIPIMRRVGLAIAVPDSSPEVFEYAHMVTNRRGGRGAVREAIEFILQAQGKWERILERYID